MNPAGLGKYKIQSEKGISCVALKQHQISHSRSTKRIDLTSSSNTKLWSGENLKGTSLLIGDETQVHFLSC